MTHPGALYEPPQFIITSGGLHEPGQQRSSQESQSGRRGVPRLAGLNVSLINPDYRHHQLLELCELNQKRWSNHLQYQNPAPSGALGGKRKERSDSGPAAQALWDPAGSHSKKGMLPVTGSITL